MGLVTVFVTGTNLSPEEVCTVCVIPGEVCNVCIVPGPCNVCSVRPSKSVETETAGVIRWVWVTVFVTCTNLSPEEVCNVCVIPGEVCNVCIVPVWGPCSVCWSSSTSPK